MVRVNVEIEWTADGREPVRCRLDERDKAAGYWADVTGDPAVKYAIQRVRSAAGRLIRCTIYRRPVSTLPRPQRRNHNG